MLACMEPDLQMQFESVHVHDMVVALNDMLTTQARAERFNVSKARQIGVCGVQMIC
jgi:hypothetical protein